MEEFASALQVDPRPPLTQPREDNGHSGEQNRAGNRQNDLPLGHDRHPKEVLARNSYPTSSLHLGVYSPPDFSTSFAVWSYSMPVGEKKATDYARRIQRKIRIPTARRELP